MLIIHAHTSEIGKPSKRSFNNPAFRNNVESCSTNFLAIDNKHPVSNKQRFCNLPVYPCQQKISVKLELFVWLE